MTSLPRAVLLAVVVVLGGACGDDSDDEDCVERSVLVRPQQGGDCRSMSSCGVPKGYVECCGGLLAGCEASGPDARCVDDPTDSCSPDRGADCPGICQ